MPAKKKTADEDAPHFESIINRLDALIQRMENSDISLEDSLNAFEQGMTLIREAQGTLATAEQRVKLLVEKNGEIVSQPLSVDENDQ